MTLIGDWEVQEREVQESLRLARVRARRSRDKSNEQDHRAGRHKDKRAAFCTLCHRKPA